jgi:PKD repeat protein
MRSLRLLAVATTVLVLGSACGGDDPPTNGGENEPPVASFTAPTNCVAGTACNFTSTSTDDEGISTYSWDFDAAGTAPNGTTQSASFTFAAAGTYPVSLTVTDGEGLTHSVTNNVIVAAAPVENVLPVAAFELATACTEGTPCGFHSLSTDPDGDITAATQQWNFGDATPLATGVDVTHTFEVEGTYNVTLTVTDALGGVGTVTQPVTVAAAASQDCTTSTPAGSNPVVNCSLTIGIRSTVTFTVVSEACEFQGNKLEILASAAVPAQAVFFNLCNQTPGNTYTVHQAGSSTPLVFEAGTVLALRMVRGTPDPTDPPAGDPGIQVDGTSPNWTLNIDDGGNLNVPGEPDFNDAVIDVTATAAP